MSSINCVADRVSNAKQLEAERPPSSTVEQLPSYSGLAESSVAGAQLSHSFSTTGLQAISTTRLYPASATKV